MAGEEHLSARLAKIESAIEGIFQNLKTLTALEVHHSETRESLERAFASIKEARQEFKDDFEKRDVVMRDFDTRIKNIEIVVPGFKRTSRWGERIENIVVSVIVMALLGLIIVKTI